MACKFTQNVSFFTRYVYLYRANSRCMLEGIFVFHPFSQFCWILLNGSFLCKWFSLLPSYIGDMSFKVINEFKMLWIKHLIHFDKSEIQFEISELKLWCMKLKLRFLKLNFRRPKLFFFQISEFVFRYLNFWNSYPWAMKMESCITISDVLLLWALYTYAAQYDLTMLSRELPYILAY